MAKGTMKLPYLELYNIGLSTTIGPYWYITMCNTWHSCVYENPFLNFFLDLGSSIVSYEIPTQSVVLRIWEFYHYSIDQLGFFF